MGQMELELDLLERPAVARTLDEDGRASDGKGINGGDTFRTLSGRMTTPYPKKKGEKWASLWLIENATAEARGREDDFNASSFAAEKPLKDGTVAPASRDCMLMYLFSWQPAVPQKLGFTLYAGH
jgi:hypothetical protein